MSEITKKLCFFCQQEHDTDGSSALFSYFVCKDCTEKMKSGLPALAVSQKPAFDGQPPICIMEDDGGEQTEMYPTGEWAVYSYEAASRLFGPEAAAQASIKGAVFLSQSAWDGIQDIYKKTMMPQDIETDDPADAALTAEQASSESSFTAFLYETDGETAADLSTYSDPDSAIKEAKERGWDEVVNDVTGEVIWKKSTGDSHE